MKENKATRAKLDAIAMDRIETTAPVGCPECGDTSDRRVFVGAMTWETCPKCKALFLLEVWVDVNTRSRCVEKVPVQPLT